MIPKGFFPQQDTGLIVGQSEAAQDISFAKMEAVQAQLGAIVQRDPDVASVAMAIGGSSSGVPLNAGRMYITLKPLEERTANAQQIIARLRRQIDLVPGAKLFMQVQQDVRMGGRASRTQYQFSLQDPNIDELNAASPQVLAKLQTLPMLRDVASDQESAGTTLTLTVDRDKASRYGIDPTLVDNTLNDAFGQRFVAQYFTQLNSYHVVLEILPVLQGDVSVLDKLYLKSPLSGGEVPLSTLAHWTTEPVRPLSISHQGQFPATTISFNLAAGVSLGDATKAVQQAVAELHLPPALQTSFAGTAQAFQDSLSTVPLLIAAALVVVYIILGILYESFVHPLTILSTLPSAGVGALATLMLFGFDFSLIALIGIILLIGIVKKNGIMMVDFAIVAEREGHLSAEEAIRKAALLRFRPIMMTTMAAMLGGLPLMLGYGTGSEIRQPLGYAMVGGLLVSQALTLFTTPVIYLYLDRLSDRVSGWWRPGAAGDEVAVPAE
jgi:hydrophobic/amphiphilic exporter-1 (mainly G- bacteria), HAE1 family